MHWVLNFVCYCMLMKCVAPSDLFSGLWFTELMQCVLGSSSSGISLAFNHCVFGCRCVCGVCVYVCVCACLGVCARVGVWGWVGVWVSGWVCRCACVWACVCVCVALKHLFDAIASCCMHFMPYILYKLCTVMDGQYLQLWHAVLSSFRITWSH